MATVSSTVLSGAPYSACSTWALAEGDDGVPAAYPEYSDRSVQVAGTFGGATVVIEGSNDGVNWSTLRDPQGSSLSLTSAGLKGVVEMSAAIRPRVTGGDGTTALTVSMFFRRTGR